MRYHLWTVLSSRAGPYGVLDSGAVTGAARPVPYCGLSGSGGCSEAYSLSAPLPSHRPGVLWAAAAPLLVLFIAMCAI